MCSFEHSLFTTFHAYMCMERYSGWLCLSVSLKCLFIVMKYIRLIHGRESVLYMRNVGIHYVVAVTRY